MKKINKINRFLIGTVLLILIASISSCLKNGTYNTPFASAAASVDLPLAAANSNNPITVTYDSSVKSASFPFYINLASPQPLGTAVTAVFALDAAYLNSYNTANGTNFVLLPDSVYTVVNGFNRTIPAGKRLDSMYVTLDLAKMDLSQPYVLPITIQSASVPIEQWNHLMIHPKVTPIPNPIAGTYEEFWSRWNAKDTSGGAAYYLLDVGPVTFDPNSRTEIQVVSQGTGETDIIDFTNTAGVLSNFTVKFPPGEAAAIGLLSMGTPVMEVADPINGIYKVYFGYVNSAGASRVIVNTYIKH